MRNNYQETTALLTVDLQREYSRYTWTWDVEQLQNTVSKYQSVFCIYDISISPRIQPLYQFIHDRALRTTNKQYVLGLYDIDNNEVPRFTQVTRGDLDFIRVDSLHYFTPLEPQVKEFIQALPQTFDMIGGGDRECLADIYDLCLYLGKQPKILTEFTF